MARDAAHGAGLLFATGAIHLDLYLTGYRTIPTIGWLFLLQVIAAFGLGATILVTSSRLVAAAGAGFAVATLGGYLLSLRVSLFGFREVRTTAGIVAGVSRSRRVAVLGAFALRPFPQGQSSGQETHERKSWTDSNNTHGPVGGQSPRSSWSYSCCWVFRSRQRGRPPRALRPRMRNSRSGRSMASQC